MQQNLVRRNGNLFQRSAAGAAILSNPITFTVLSGIAIVYSLAILCVPVGYNFLMF